MTDYIAGWLQVRGPVMDFFFFHLLFEHTLCSLFKGFRPQGLLVYTQALPSPDTSIIFVVSN